MLISPFLPVFNTRKFSSNDTAHTLFFYLDNKVVLVLIFSNKQVAFSGLASRKFNEASQNIFLHFLR